MALREMPRVGGRVTVDFLDATSAATVGSVSPDGRRLEVTTDDGETLAFALNRATARFTAGGRLTGPRLRFGGSADDPAAGVDRRSSGT